MPRVRQALKRAYKKRRVMRGKGSYYSEVFKPTAKKVLRRVGRYAGSAVGAAVGGGAGSTFGPSGIFKGATLGTYLGGVAGNYAGRHLGNTLFGKGAYRTGMGAPSGGSLARLLNYDANGELPAMHNRDQSIRFRYREYLGDVTCSSAFSLSSYNINPGLVASFPYLSQIANQFQEYKFHGLVFYYKSNTANAISTTNGALGTVVMATDYNASNSAFLSKQQMLDSQYAVDSPPTKDIIHCIEQDPHKNQNSVFYVRSGANPSGTDIKLYDIGLFQIATQGQQSAFNAGELFVIYDVELLKPILGTSLGQDILAAHYSFPAYTNSAPMYNIGGVSSFVYDNIGLTGNKTTGTIITFPVNLQGNFLCIWRWHGSSCSLTYPTFTFSAGVATLTFFAGETNNVSETEGTPLQITGCNYVALVQFTPNGTAQTVTLSTGGTLPSSGTAGDFMCLQMNNNMT